jgi:hypothetical protein
MAYILEKITLEDREKIIKDAACDEVKQHNLSYAKNHNDFPETWTINRECNYYLFLAPIITRPEIMKCPLYFYFKKNLYEIYFESAFGNKIGFLDVPAPELLKEFQKELVVAFAVFGRGGHGALNEFGNPEFSIVPEFGEEN